MLKFALVALAACLASCSSGEKQAFKVLETFADAVREGDFESARQLAGSEADDSLAAAETRFAASRLREEIREIHTIRHQLDSSRKLAGGILELTVTQVVRFDPPGTHSTTGVLAATHRLVATLGKRGAGWKVLSFADETQGVAPMLPGLP